MGEELREESLISDYLIIHLYIYTFRERLSPKTTACFTFSNSEPGVRTCHFLKFLFLIKQDFLTPEGAGV